VVSKGGGEGVVGDSEEIGGRVKGGGGCMRVRYGVKVVGGKGREVRVGRCGVGRGGVGGKGNGRSLSLLLVEERISPENNTQRAGKALTGSGLKTRAEPNRFLLGSNCSENTWY